jgi:hypothetical protein
LLAGAAGGARRGRLLSAGRPANGVHAQSGTFITIARADSVSVDHLKSIRHPASFRREARRRKTLKGMEAHAQ